jgi:hypothetical protein
MTAKRPTNRRGLAIVPALVCLVLVTMLCALMLKQAHTRRVLAGDEERRMQAEWLAESGLARASARLSAKPGYRGETWEIPPRALGGASAARVSIVVEPVEDPSGRRRARVVVRADYPGGDDHRARQSKHLIVELRPDTPGGPT